MGWCGVRGKLSIAGLEGWVAVSSVNLMWLRRCQAVDLLQPRFESCMLEISKLGLVH